MKIPINVILSLVFVILLGLASRKYVWLFPDLFGKYPGDALWAVAAYLGLKMLASNRAPIMLGMLALAVSFIIEFSQLYHVAWLDKIRNTVIGHLFLGSTFNVLDLVAYSVGVAAIVFIDYVLVNRNADSTTKCITQPL